MTVILRAPVGELLKRRVQRSDARTPKQAEPDTSETRRSSEVKREELPNWSPELETWVKGSADFSEFPSQIPDDAAQRIECLVE